MNETKNMNTKSADKKSADGLTKKERRALKLAEKGISINTNEPHTVQTAKLVEPPPVRVDKTDTQTLSKKECKAEKGVSIQINASPNTSLVNPPTKQVDNKLKTDTPTLSKKERRALKIDEKQPKVVIIKEDIINTKLEQPSLENKVKTESSIDETKSKAQLRAERREIQEKQRLAKVGKDVKVETKKVVAKSDVKTKIVLKSPKKDLINKKEILPNQVRLFNHLDFELISKNKSIITNVHPSFIRLGVQYLSKTILGSNARCLALLSSVKDLIDDFITPPKQELCRSLETYLQNSVTYLQICRPFAVSMTNALRHFKVHLTQVRTDLSDIEKKIQLHKIIDVYIQDEIQTAGQAISMKVAEKICNGDVLLTYGCSSLIKKILVDAHEDKKTFKVIVVDSRPLLEGREMLRKLVTVGLDCTYVLINSVSFIMGTVTKVLVGAHALLANGYVMSRTGTAQIALIAQDYNKPVLVCCETYKFSERVQTDSFVYNEIGDAESLSTIDTLEESSPLQNIGKNDFLTPLNLMYDITPPDFITAVVTELGFLPCTSVPVILRIKPTE